MSEGLSYGQATDMRTTKAEHAPSTAKHPLTNIAWPYTSMISISRTIHRYFSLNVITTDFSLIVMHTAPVGVDPKFGKLNISFSLLFLGVHGPRFFSFLIYKIHLNIVLLKLNIAKYKTFLVI